MVKEKLTDRERFNKILNYKPVDRCFFRGAMGAWPETIERWQEKGYSEQEIKSTLSRGDRWEWQGGWFFPDPPFEKKIVSEDENNILYVNHEGILMKERKDHPMSSMPQFVKFPVENREDFRKFSRERMQPDLSSRIGEDWQEKLEAYQDRDYPLIIISDRWGGFFGPLRNLVGVDNLCKLFYDDPDFLEEMMDRFADFIIAIMDKILDHTDIDVFGFWEDMAYKNAPLISPKMVRKYMLPRYKRVVEFLKGRGVKWIALDSDGQVSSLIPIWMEAGINFLYPFEVQAGMDVIQVRQEYGRELRMFGGVNKRPLIKGEDAINRELERIAPLIGDGGYIPMLDHSVPPDIPFENYRYYLDKLYEIL